MPYFKWHAVTQDKRVIEGVEFSRAKEVLAAALTKRGFQVLAIDEKQQTTSISGEERALFFRQLSSLLVAGIPVIDALAVCKKTVSKAQFQEVIADCQAAVGEGLALSVACSFHPDFFPTFVCRLLEAGEELGTLAQVCSEVADHYEALTLFSKKVRSALVVPLITVLCFLGVFGLLFGFVIPRFGVLLRSMHVQLSWKTELLLRFSDWLQTGGWAVALGGLIVGMWAIRVILRRRSQQEWGQWLLYVPFFGSWLREVNAAAFFRTLGALLEGGVDIAKALSMACLGVSCSSLARKYESVAAAVTAGRSLSQALADAHLQQTPLCNALIEVGESTGKLGALLLKCAEDYDQRLLARLTLLSTVVQPLILLVLGIGIALLMFALYEPLFTMGSMIGQ